MDGGADWANLPLELWPQMAKRLKTHLELLRFRSVCTTWRSSIPPFRPSIPLKFPFPNSDGSTGFLSHTTLYLLRPDQDPNPNQSTSSSSKGWLLKLEQRPPEKLRLLNPITSWRIGHLNDAVRINPTDLNLLDFNMVELSKAYAIRYQNGFGSVCGLNKVIKAPNLKECSIFIIYNEGKLGFAKNGDQTLTLINDQISDFDDLIVYKGQSYVVDKSGQVCRIDLNLKLVVFSPSIGFGHRKNLIECCGELYVIDRYLDHADAGGVTGVGESMFFLRHPLRRRRFYEAGQPKVVDFKVYKLEEELGRWVEVKSLGDQAFFLSIDCCFSVLATELNGCKGNCIYFTDQNDIGLALRELIRPDGSVFSLEDHSIERLGSSAVYSKMFWPLPI